MRNNASSVKKDKEGVIFHAALRVIRKKGFHKARMADIAREAGISYGLVYHYFKNKEDLFDAVINRWWEGLYHLMETVAASDAETEKKLQRVIDYHLDTYQANPELGSIFITEISRAAANLTEERLERFKKFMSLVERLIAEGQARKTIRSDYRPRYLTYIFLGAIETFLSALVFAERNIEGTAQRERIAECILEVFLNGAKAPGE
jgi:TetR/AcrR family fatty acid metabolism transcriptional regulator